MSTLHQSHIKDHSPVRFIASCRLPTQWGEFTMHGFEDVRNRQEHIALTVGDISTGEDILGRIHSECLTVHSIQLMTNNPQKVDTLKALGINVTNRVPLHVGLNPENQHYLQTKMEKMGHFAN